MTRPHRLGLPRHRLPVALCECEHFCQRQDPVDGRAQVDQTQYVRSYGSPSDCPARPASLGQTIRGTAARSRSNTSLRGSSPTNRAHGTSSSSGRAVHVQLAARYNPPGRWLGQSGAPCRGVRRARSPAHRRDRRGRGLGSRRRRYLWRLTRWYCCSVARAGLRWLRWRLWPPITGTHVGNLALSSLLDTMLSNHDNVRIGGRSPSSTA
jgi:hypothetical protein